MDVARLNVLVVKFKQHGIACGVACLFFALSSSANQTTSQPVPNDAKDLTDLATKNHQSYPTSEKQNSHSLKQVRHLETSHEETDQHLQNFHSVELTPSERQWLDKKQKVVVAFDGNFPPYSFINEHGDFEGISVEITRRLARRLGISLEIYPHGQWPLVFAAGQQRKVDIVAALGIRPYRQQWFEFTRPYLTLSNYVVTRKENAAKYKNLDNLKGKKVLALPNSLDTEALLKRIPDVDIEYIDNLPEALERVSIGEAEATVGDISVVNYYMSRKSLSNLSLSANLARDERMAFGVRKDMPQLAGIFDKALETLSTLELNQLYAHWYVPKQIKQDTKFLSVINVLTEEEKAWLKEHPVIRLASDSAWPPYESIDNAGRYEGICASYMTLVAERLGIQLEISPVEGWYEIQQMLRNKQLDVFPCVTSTSNRQTFASLTEPYITHPIVMITREDIGYIDNLRDILDKSIAVEKGYASAEFLLQDHAGLDLILYKNSQDALLAVSKGEAFAYAGNIATMSHVTRKYGITNVKVSGQLPYHFSLSMGVRDDWPILSSIMQKALDSISLDERTTIAQKWINIDVEKKKQPLPLIYFAVVFFLVIIILIFVRRNRS